MMDAETAFQIANGKKPKHIYDAEKKLRIILIEIEESACRGEMEYTIDLTSDIKAYYPNQEYWHQYHDPFRIHLTKLLRSLGYSVKHRTDYNNTYNIKVYLHISWWKRNVNDKALLCCGKCNNTFCGL
jgi:hypothetical protein